MKLAYLLIGMAWAWAGGVAAQTAGAPAGQDIPDEVVRKVDPSVVAIQHERAGGSGFVVSEDGYILTNGHVVRGADEEDPTQPAKAITVILFDEQKYPAKVIGFSMDPDVALIKIDAGRPLRPVEFADSRAAQVGQVCFAVGTPVGLKRTFTRGILSNVERTDLGTEVKVFQTDAAINPGNSGGPLFDRDGRVLGLNTYSSGRGVNLGFTIPIHVAAVLKEHFLAYGRFARSDLPVFSAGELYDELARALGVEKGMLVEYVMTGSPAYEAGLREGDIIVEQDGKPCSARTRAELLDHDWELMIRKPGEVVKFGVLRGPKGDRKKVDVSLKLETMEPLPTMGLHAGELPEHRIEALGLGVVRLLRLHRVIHAIPDVEGVLVTHVKTGSPAEKAGLRKLDVIARVGDRPVVGVPEFRRELEARLASRAKAIELTIVRGKRTTLTAIAPYYYLRDKKAALIVPPGEPEFVDLVRRELVAEGAVVTVASVKGGAIEIGGEKVNGVSRLADLKGGEFDIVVFAGGAGGRELWANEDAKRLVRQAFERKALIAAIGPASLVPVTAVKDLQEKKMTTSREVSAEALQRKANYTGKDVESDGRLVTTTGFDRATVRDFLKTLKRVAWNET